MVQRVENDKDSKYIKESCVPCALPSGRFAGTSCQVYICNVTNHAFYD